MTPEIDILLAKYFGGAISTEEMAVLDNWLALSDKNEVYFEKMTRIFELSVRIKPTKIDEAKALHQFKKYIQQSAATTEDATKSTLSETKNQKTDTKKGKIRMIVLVTTAIAASITIIITLLRVDMAAHITEQIITTTSIAETTPLEIYNGVIMQPDTSTTVRYKVKADTLEVTLDKGKIKVDVTRSDKKLLIAAHQTFVEDIGTIFYVTAYPLDNKIIVQVEYGEVRFYSTSDNGIFITQGMTGVYYENEMTFDMFETVSYATAEKAAETVEFSSTSLEDVAFELSHLYNLVIEVDRNVAQMHISVSFSGEETIDEILEIIAETLSINLTKTDSGYFISN